MHKAPSLPGTSCWVLYCQGGCASPTGNCIATSPAPNRSTNYDLRGVFILFFSGQIRWTWNYVVREDIKSDVIHESVIHPFDDLDSTSPG